MAGRCARRQRRNRDLDPQLVWRGKDEQDWSDLVTHAPPIYIQDGTGLSVGPRGLHFGVNRRGMYTSAGTPGTGIYAVHHIRRSSGEHPTVAGSAWPVIVLLAVLLLVSSAKACA